MDQLQSITAAWQLTDLRPSHATTACTVFTGFREGQPIVLKCSGDASALRQEAQALQAFSSYGAIQLLEHQEGALLLERAIPGGSLKNYFPDQEDSALQIVCALIKKLHQAPIPKAHSLPHIADWLSVLDTELALPKEHFEKARALNNHLLKTSAPSVLLHGDLHHDNILEQGTGWVAIDPKGVIGEPAYEVGAFIRNPLSDWIYSENSRAVIERRVAYFARALQLDAMRIWQWNFVQAVLSWGWALEDDFDPKHFEHLTRLFSEKV